MAIFLVFSTTTWPVCVDTKGEEYKYCKGEEYKYRKGELNTEMGVYVLRQVHVEVILFCIHLTSSG